MTDTEPCISGCHPTRTGMEIRMPDLSSSRERLPVGSRNLPEPVNDVETRYESV